MDGQVIPNDAEDSGPEAGLRDKVLALNFLAEVGRQLLESSTSVSEVTYRLVDFLPAVGLEGCAVDAGLRSVTLSYWEPGQAMPLTLMQTVGVTQPRLERLTGTLSIMEQVERGDLGVEEAYERLRAQGHTGGVRQALGRAAILLSVGGWVLFLQGFAWVTILVALLGTLLTFPVDTVVRRLRLPVIMATLLAAIILAAVPNIVAGLGLSFSVSAAVVGGLFIYLPGRALVSAVTDGLSGAPISSIARAFEALITTAALALGVIVGGQIGTGLGVAIQVDTSSMAVWLSALGSAVGMLGLALAWGMPRIRMLPAVAIGTLGGVIVAFAGHGTATAGWLAYLLAAVLVGLFGVIVAYLQGGSASAYTGVAILPLVPGFIFYQGVLAVTQGRTEIASVYLQQTLVIALSVAGGVTIGIALGRNLQAMGKWVSAKRQSQRSAH